MPVLPHEGLVARGGRPGRELRGFRGYDRAARQEDRGAGRSMLLTGWAGR